MEPALQISAARIAFTALAITLEIALPLALAVAARRRLGISWRYVGYGALIFTLFQLVTRLPLVTIAQTLLGTQLRESVALQWAWVAMLVLTAGLFEEIGRYLGYRWLMRREPKTWGKAVLYGIGHGGIESIVLVAGITLLGLINLIVLPSVLGQLPAEQQDIVSQQLAAVAEQPVWLALVGVYERVWAMAVHVALSVVVLQVFQRSSMRWLWLSVGLHALVNSAAFFSLLGLDPMLLILLSEAWVTLFGVLSLWVILRLRPPADMPAAEEHEQPSVQPAH